MRRITITLGAAALLLAAAAFSGAGRPQAAHGGDTGTTGVTVTGHGVVDSVPDTVDVSVGVRTTGETADAALAANAARIQKVIAALKAAGARDLQTQQVSLYPRQRDDGTIHGYEAQNTVSSRTAVAKAGGLVDAAVGAGANTVEGPMLSVSDRDARYRDALKRALADAKRKAEALAEQGGFSVGPVEAIQETAEQPVPVYDRAAVSSSKEATPVEPGTQEIAADVQVTFGIG